jgi:hypothetical protein
MDSCFGLFSSELLESVSMENCDSRLRHGKVPNKQLRIRNIAMLKTLVACHAITASELCVLFREGYDGTPQKKQCHRNIELVLSC